MGAFGSLWQPWVFSETQRPCFPCSPHPLAPPCPLSLPEPLGPSSGLSKPWEPLQAFGSLGSSVRLRSLASLISPHSLLPRLTPSCPLSLPGFPWAPGTFLGPQKALGAFAGLQQSLAALGLQSDSGALLPLLPLTSLTPSRPLSPPEPPWVSLGSWDFPGASGSLGSLQKPSTALGLQSDSEALLPLLSLPPCSLLLPGPLWAHGTFLGPQEALGSLCKSMAALGLQSDSGALLPLLPLTSLTPSHSLSPPEPPWVFLGPWDLPGALGSLGSLQKPSAALGLQSDSEALLPLLPSPPCSLSLPGPLCRHVISTGPWPLGLASRPPTFGFYWPRLAT